MKLMTEIAPPSPPVGALRHFRHAASARCLVCFLDQVGQEELDRAAEVIKRENRLVMERGGLELKLLMDKRVLEESETLLLLCASAYAANEKAEKIYVYYYVLCSKLRDMKKFKRFRDTHSYNNLRRRLRQLRKTYGKSNAVLYQLSKHPMNKIVERALTVLFTLERMQVEQLSSVLTRATVHDAAEFGAEFPANGQVMLNVNKRQRDSKEGAWSNVLDLPSHPVPGDDFFYHHLQQYDELNVDLRELYNQAFRWWIPSLARATAEEKRKLIQMLKSLLFISIKEKQKPEALRIAQVLLENTRKDENDYWRLHLYASYLSEDIGIETFECDLYQKFVDHLTFSDKQIYLSMKFDVLLRFSRFALAKEVADAIEPPHLRQHLGVWIRMLECKLIFPFVHANKAAIETILEEQISKVGGLSEKRSHSDVALSEVFIGLVKAVSKSYPIHLSFLKKLGALFLTIVCGFEGKQAAEDTMKAFSEHGLSIPQEMYTEKLISCALLAFEAGNMKLTQRLGLAYSSANHNHEDAWQLLCCLGQLEASQNNAPKAEKHLKSSLDLVLQHRGKSNSYAFCLLVYAHTIFLQGKLREAEILLKQCMETFKRHRSQSNYILAAFTYVMVLWKTQAWEAAIDLLSESEKMLDTIRGKDQRHQAAAVYTALAFSHFELGDMVRADEYQKKLFMYVDREQFGVDSPTISACKQCSTWKEWVDTLTASVPNHLDLVSFLIYPGPSTGTEQFALDEEETASLQTAWTLLADAG